MSDPNQEQQKPDEPVQNEQQPEEDPNALTQQDKKVYSEIMGSINRMNKKLENAKEKVPQSSTDENQPIKQFDNKKISVAKIAQKLIEAKQNSQIVNKQDLITDVQQSFEQMVVDVYSQNQQLKAKIESLVAIIKNQNKKVNQHIENQNKLKQENQSLREQLTAQKDQQLMTKSIVKPVDKNNNLSTVKGGKNRVNTYESQGQDYDFWNMPQNQSSVKKRKDFVADSSLWVNDKDIDKSVFITDQTNKGRR